MKRLLSTRCSLTFHSGRSCGYGAIFVVGYGDVLVFLIKSGNAPSWVCIIEPPKDLMQIFIDGCKAPGIEVLQLYFLA